MEMQDAVDWITDALSKKNIAKEMTHYRVENGEIRATDGRLVAGHPFPHPGPFLVPGAEFEKILRKFAVQPTIEVGEGNVVLKTSRARGTIQTLPLDKWDYGNINEDAWEDVPEGLVPTLRDLLPFVSDNATQPWALGIALNHGYAYATNNVALAGVRCPMLGEIAAILPVWAAQFVCDREEGLVEWCWTDHYLAFRWSNGAWMRSQLIDATFPDQAIQMILSAEQAVPSFAISTEFRALLDRAASLSDGLLHITSSGVKGSFGHATYEEDSEDSSTFESLGDLDTMWSSKYLLPVIKVAQHWSPEDWPKSKFRGERIFGWIAGRRS